MQIEMINLIRSIGLSGADADRAVKVVGESIRAALLEQSIDAAIKMLNEALDGPPDEFRRKVIASGTILTCAWERTQQWQPPVEPK